MELKTTPRQAEIYGFFDGLSDIYPDKSTEFLMQMTADTMKCSVEEVAYALHANTVAQEPAEVTIRRMRDEEWKS